MTPNTDSLAVLRVLRDFYAGSVLNHPEKVAALDAAITALSAQGEEYPEAAEVCGEAYQVVGSLLCDVGAFDTEKGIKILDNLSQHRMVHKDVLPWPPFPHAPPGSDAVTEEMVDAALGEYVTPSETLPNRSILRERMREALTAALAARTGKGGSDGR